MVVDHDCPAVVGSNARLLQAEGQGVGASTGCNQQPVARELLRVRFREEPVCLEANAPQRRMGEYAHAFAFKYVCEPGADRRVFLGQQGGARDQSHFRTQPQERLREFESDHRSAIDDQMFGQIFGYQGFSRSPVRRVPQARYAGDRG